MSFLEGNSLGATQKNYETRENCLWFAEENIFQYVLIGTAHIPSGF